MTQRIAILGGGLMGHGIAQVFACAGHHVKITDPLANVRAAILDRIGANLDDLSLARGALARVAVVETLESCVVDADFVIEAAPEDLTLMPGRAQSPDAADDLVTRVEQHPAVPDGAEIPLRSPGEIVKDVWQAGEVIGVHPEIPFRRAHIVSGVGKARAPSTLSVPHMWSGCACVNTTFVTLDT